MYTTKKQRIGIFFVGSILLGCSQKKDIEINYFDQTSPGTKAEIFAPGLISLPNRWEGNAGFSADGTQFFFNVFKDASKTIYASTFKGGQWTNPIPMPQLTGFNSWEPFPSWNGNRLYFVTDQAPGRPEWNGRIWYSQKDGDMSWTKPQHLDLQIVTENGLWFPNVSKNNRLFFGGRLASVDSVGKGDMYYADLKDKKIRLIPNICSIADDWDPFVAPDESFILWASDRPGGFGGMDLYVSFNTDREGRWGPPINLGERVNTKGYEVAPRISPDGKFLFFDRPKKGTQDIYWISVEVIENVSSKIDHFVY